MDKLPIKFIIRWIGPGLTAFLFAEVFGHPIPDGFIKDLPRWLILFFLGIIVYTSYHVLIYQQVISRLHDLVRKIIKKPNHRGKLKMLGLKHSQSMRVWDAMAKPHLLDKYKHIEWEASVIHLFYIIFLAAVGYYFFGISKQNIALGVAIIAGIVALLFDWDYESREAIFYDSLPGGVKSSFTK